MEKYILRSSSSNYLFNHCVIKLQKISNDNFKNVIFITENDENKMEYRMTGGEKNKYMYDFRPDKETTPGVGKPICLFPRNIRSIVTASTD